MRTYIRIILFFLFSVITLNLFTNSSCEKGVEPEKNVSIIGTWRMVNVKMKDTLLGDLTLTAEYFLEMSGTGATSSILQINEDGTASVTTTYTDSSEVVVPGTWTIDGNKLTMEGAGIDDTVTYEVDGNTLTLTMIMSIDFDSNGTPEDIEIDMIYNRM